MADSNRNARCAHPAAHGHSAIWEVQNADHFHLSEPEVVNLMINRCAKLVSMEDALSAATLAADLSSPVGSGPNGVRGLRAASSTAPYHDQMPRETREIRDIRVFERHRADLLGEDRPKSPVRPKSSPGQRPFARSDRTIHGRTIGGGTRGTRPKDNVQHRSNLGATAPLGSTEQRSYNYYNDSEFLRKSVQAKASRQERPKQMSSRGGFTG